jgi:outer membrane beta-barrel protein
MMNQAQTSKFLFVIFLTSAAIASTQAAPPAGRRPAAQANPQQRTAPQATQSQQLAPPANESTIRPATSDADEAGTLPERIDVQSMKRRYWTVGNEDLMDVVQNRLYTKKGRMEFAARYGFWSDDPFQSQKTMGLSAGYHLSEFLSLHGFYATVSASNNQAYTAALAATGNTIYPDINPTKSVYGAEARASLIYGKLSLLGNAIVYYDLNVAAGLSQHQATVGSSTGYFVGLGQQFYLNKTLFLTVDYRMLFHTDKFPASNNPALERTRALTTSWIQLGLGVFAF